LSDLDIQPTACGARPPSCAAAAAAFDSEAARVFATEYTMAPNHKAFAVSGKAYGWRTGMATAQDAAAQALANCEEHRAAHTEPCELISVDGSGYGPEDAERARPPSLQICTRVPSSTTALPGSRKNSTTPLALRLMAAKSDRASGCRPRWPWAPPSRG
jgi:hypothetical protein